MPKMLDNKQLAVLLEAQKVWLAHVVGYTDTLDISNKTLLQDKRSRDRLTRWLLDNNYIQRHGYSRTVTEKVYQVLEAAPPQELATYPRDLHWIEFLRLPPAEQKWLLEHPADYLWAVRRSPWRSQQGVIETYLPVTEPRAAVQRISHQDRTELGRELHCPAHQIDAHYSLFFTTTALIAQTAAERQRQQQAEREHARQLAPRFNLSWGLVKLGLCPPPERDVAFNYFTGHPRRLLTHVGYPDCPLEADALAQWFQDAASRLIEEYARMHQSYLHDLEWLNHVCQAVKQRYGGWEEALRHYHDEVCLELEKRWRAQDSNTEDKAHGT